MHLGLAKLSSDLEYHLIPPITASLLRTMCMQVMGNSLDIPIPVQMCLPIDELQRRAEELEFSELLDQVQQPFTGSSLQLCPCWVGRISSVPPQSPY